MFRRKKHIAKEQALSALREFLETPDDLVTLQMATQALKNVTRILLENE